MECRDCGKRYTNQGGHCVQCHVSFAGDGAFDAHIRQGSVHVDVTTAGGKWRQNQNGYWTNSKPLVGPATWR